MPFELLIPIIAIGVVIFASFKTVPQGYNWIVERFGKYQTTLEPGLRFIIPFVDKVVYKITTKDIVLDIPTQEVITKDNAVVLANAVAFINITQPNKAVYGVENYTFAIQNLVQTAFRSIIGEMSLDDTLSSREQIKALLRDSIAKEITNWGIALNTVEVQDIKPSPSMQLAMEEQAAAERHRRAAVTKADGDREAAILSAEGEKQAAILTAEGDLEAAKLDANAQVALAKASKISLELVKDGIGQDDKAAAYLLGERFADSYIKLSESDNTKMVLLPADLASLGKSLLGK